MHSSTRALAATLVAVATWALVAGAAALAQQREPIVHEYFEYTNPGPVPDGSDPRGLPRPGLVAPGQGPAAGPTTSDPLVLAPGGSIPAPGYFGDDAGGLRNGAGTPEAEVGFDAETGPEGWLHYHTVFDPTIAPWKRGVARDHVRWQDGQVTLGIGSPHESPVSIAGAPPDGYDAFVGSLVVLARAGERTPIPSVAPDMLVHRVRVEPPAGATLTRDGAGNYFLRLDESGRHAVTLDVSAPAFYFGGPIPETGAARPVPRVDAEVAASAQPVVEAVGVTPRMTELEAVRALTDYFRGFAAAPLPPELRTGDTYRDVALARVGVCRHRALGFVVTAAAVGVRARYVHNEAHAFVEVHLTGLGWRRIDLGGGAAGMTTTGHASRAHVPGEDPFGRSETDDTWAEAVAEATGPSAGSTRDPDEEQGPGGTGDAGPGAQTSPTPGVTHGEPAPAGAPPPSADPRLPATLGFDAPTRAYRGDEVVVRGTLRGPTGAPLAGRTVTFVLVREGIPYLALGDGETGEDGTVEASVRLPSTLPVGSWEIVATFAGDDTHLPSMSP